MKSGKEARLKPNDEAHPLVGRWRLQLPPNLSLPISLLAPSGPRRHGPLLRLDVAGDPCSHGPERGPALRVQGVGQYPVVVEELGDPLHTAVEERGRVPRPVRTDPQNLQ